MKQKTAKTQELRILDRWMKKQWGKSAGLPRPKNCFFDGLGEPNG
jgi:hypothetical protein